MSPTHHSPGHQPLLALAIGWGDSSAKTHLSRATTKAQCHVRNPVQGSLQPSSASPNPDGIKPNYTYITVSGAHLSIQCTGDVLRSSMAVGIISV